MLSPLATKGSSPGSQPCLREEGGSHGAQRRVSESLEEEEEMREKIMLE